MQELNAKLSYHITYVRCPNLKYVVLAICINCFFETKITFKLYLIQLRKNTKCFQIASKDWTFLICGIGTKVVHTTTDNVAYILFHSDYSINKIGFNLTFTSIEG